MRIYDEQFIELQENCKLKHMVLYTSYTTCHIFRRSPKKSQISVGPNKRFIIFQIKHKKSYVCPVLVKSF